MTTSRHEILLDGAAYYEGGGEPPAAREVVLADVGRLIAEIF